ncbi:hypothetical protein FB45DRAFT_952116 [Roridomyces roridus]|uniref:Protein kinase domain-containing protein n=1 Tax=Roridomyces roridus TaxID=1738132 RepID=A0AAD7AZZ7_9AGAR|nr:hypothetical protein FB45DRAFT_952116 [Roridomyces roridus]
MAAVDALHLLTGAVHTLAGVAPVPGLAAAFTVFHFICSCVRTIRVRQKQLAVLSNAIAQLLSTLQQEFEANRLVPISCVQPLHNLHQLLNDIHKFVQAEKDRSFFKAMLLHTDSQVSMITMFYHRIDTATSSFQISSALNIQHMLHANEQARLADVSALAERFEILEKNHDELRRELDVNNKNIVAMMVSIERRMDRSQNNMNATEQKFYSHTLQYLASTSGQHIELEDWMISQFDVDINIKIGAGGFGTVFKGTWNHTEVAIKMIHNDSGITADISMLRHEIDIWMTLRHPPVHGGMMYHQWRNSTSK